MEEKTANIILGLSGPGDGFTLRYGVFKFKLQIKALSTRQVIAISKELSKIEKIREEEISEVFPSLVNRADNLRHIAKCIAIATGSKWRRIITLAVMDLPLEDIYTLFKIVHKQSDPEPFFFTIILARGRMNILTAPDQ